MDNQNSISTSQQELLHNQRIDTFKKSIERMIAANRAAYVKTDSKYVRQFQRFYNKEEIRRIIDNGDPVEQCHLSEYFFKVSGIYKRIIIHYATFLRYSWLLVPHKSDRRAKITDKKIQKSYEDAIDFCSTFQIERKCSLFMKDVLVKGAYYGLIHDDGKNIVIQDLPFEYCRSRFKNQQDIDIVEFNLAFFDTIKDDNLRVQILKTYPKIVQKAYYKYKNRNGEKWLFLPAEMGVYFSYFEERPFFLDLIPLLDDLDDYKEIDKKRNLQSLSRIMTQRIPVDKGELVFEPEEAEEMHRGVCEMLRNNSDIDVITGYANYDLLDVSSDADKVTAVSDVQDLIFQAAGISKEYFFSTTEAGLNYSMKNDLSMMMIMGQNFAHFFTTLINYKYSQKKLNFELLILPLSFYNDETFGEQSRQLATLGYSFLTPGLVNGVNQSNLADLKELENELLELDEILKPLQTSYTQSGKVGDTPASVAEKTSEARGVKSESEKKEEEQAQEDNQETENQEQKDEQSEKKE